MSFRSGTIYRNPKI